MKPGRLKSEKRYAEIVCRWRSNDADEPASLSPLLSISSDGANIKGGEAPRRMFTFGQSGVGSGSDALSVIASREHSLLDQSHFQRDDRSAYCVIL